MKILVNGKYWQEIKEANNFNELLLFLAKELKNKVAQITYWDRKEGILIDGKDLEGNDISYIIETEEQANKGGV